MARCSFPCSLSLSLTVAILLLLFFLKQTETVGSKKFSGLTDVQGENSSCGSGAGDHRCGACDACWTHRSLLWIPARHIENCDAGMAETESNKYGGIAMV
jgi:hypothetical protein